MRLQMKEKNKGKQVDVFPYLRPDACVCNYNMVQ